MEHILTNGYANGWYIDPEKMGQDSFTLTLYYWPQNLAYLGRIIAALTMVLCLTYLIVKLRKQKPTGV